MAEYFEVSPVDNVSGQSVLLIACGALAKEILAIKEQNNWTHLELKCLPAQLHLRPERIPAAVERAVEENRNEFDRIYIVYADCGTGGLLQAKCEELGVKMVRGAHCYAFFNGVEQFESCSEENLTSFFLTDFLVRQFNSFVVKPLGLDRHPELRDIYFGNYTHLIFLAQTDDSELDKLAAHHARYLGLKYLRRYTGYGDLTQALNSA